MTRLRGPKEGPRFTLSFALLVAGAFTGLFSAQARAANIEASAYLGIFNYKVINAATGLPITAGAGGDISVAGTSMAATSSATLNGLTDGHNAPTSTDALAAFSNGLAVGAPGGTENVFSPRPLAVAAPYARADTNGSGTIATLLPGPPTAGARAETIADLLVPNSLTIANLGEASSSATGFSVVLQVQNQLSIYLDFEAAWDVTLDYSLPPAGLQLIGSTSFGTTLIGTGVTVGGVTSSIYTFAPAQLNTGAVTRSAAGITGGHPGIAYTGSSRFTTPVLTLTPGPYSFMLTQGAGAAIVPEPASFLLTFLAAVCLAARFRRRH